MVFMGNRVAPVKEGEELDVKIEAVGEKGDGIAKRNGFVLFVPGTRAGDEVRIKVTKVLRKAGFAEVVGKAESTAALEPKPEVDLDESKDSEDFGDEPGEDSEPEEDSDDDSKKEASEEDDSDDDSEEQDEDDSSETEDSDDDSKKEASEEDDSDDSDEDDKKE